jgi:hypothetical protein
MDYIPACAEDDGKGVLRRNIHRLRCLDTGCPRMARADGAGHGGDGSSNAARKQRLPAIIDSPSFDSTMRYIRIPLSSARRLYSTEPPLPPPPPRWRWPPARQLVYPLILLSALSSAAVNLRNSRELTYNTVSHLKAQVSTLEDLVDRVRRGEDVDAAKLHRELARVGLRERVDVAPAETKVGWKEALFGRKKRPEDEEEVDLEQRKIVPDE